ncbi:small RNA 2'-O-methyltransferase-like [Dendronephthya gigantea]|uniref:small RNA 2'-O-methyltransferase-like n=1 Tax=Dendronephthya gigantea TaxID=151771 RepID=UPI00106DA044|nr:small RNA 2'-O-methyltransferase-like [Dendronephthya gigantea]
MDEEDCQSRKGGPVFDPPVYKQRYNFVENIVRKFGAKKVIDFGCSEGKLISQLKRVECVEELVGIDIDHETLEFNKRRARPFSADYLDPRSKPLTVSLYQGSIAEYDERFINFDVIACVEIIEHLHPPVLSAMPEIIFGHLQPKVAVVTTPNSEFNVLFPDLKGFRHYDHKFEWNRAEFQSWGLMVASKYNYSVSFSGVGEDPSGTEHLGKCSQIAVLVKSEGKNEIQNQVPQEQTPYVKVISCVHPFKKERSLEELLTEELEYYTLFLADDFKKEEHSRCSEIPLESFFEFPRISKLTTDVEVLRKVIQASPKLELNDALNAVVYERADNEWPSDEEGEEGITKWDSEGVGNYYERYYKLDCPNDEECWDMENAEMESDDKEIDNWSNWRSTNISGDCEHQRSKREEFFADND